MKNKNVLFFDEEQKRAPRGVSPFDLLLDYEQCILECSHCHQPLTKFPINVRHVQNSGEFIYDTNGRIHNLIVWEIKKHPCLQNQANEKRISEEELMSGRIKIIQKRLDEIYEPKPMFRVGMWVINVSSGYLWQIDEKELEAVTKGYENGKRNVMPYE